MTKKVKLDVGLPYKDYGLVEEIKDKEDCYIVHTKKSSLRVEKNKVE